MLAKFSEVESKRTVFKFWKRKSNFLCCFYLLHKTDTWNWEASCSIRASKKGTKKASSAYKFLVLLIHSYCLHCKLPIVVIQTFCYHGDVTSHFSLLCSLAVILGFTAVRELNDVAYLLDRSLRSLISSVDMTKFVIPFLWIVICALDCTIYLLF